MEKTDVSPCFKIDYRLFSIKRLPRQSYDDMFEFQITSPKETK